jgi:hypothetical protein
MLDRMKSMVIVALGAVFALGLVVYAYVHQYFTSKGATIAQADSCDLPEGQVSAKQNPNKMLFISCGGFLE